MKLNPCWYPQLIRIELRIQHGSDRISYTRQCKEILDDRADGYMTKPNRTVGIYDCLANYLVMKYCFLDKEWKRN
jgi:hypothetical protein